MRFNLAALTLPSVLAVALVGCAPRAVTPAPTSDLRASFSDAGVVWTAGGRACVARAPAFQAVCPQVGQVADVSWHGQNAWAALPLSGLITTLDRAPQTLAVGAAAVLSGQAIYRQDGSALTYSGEPAAGVPGQPSLALTGGDGLDYVLLGGQLIRVGDNRVIDPLGATFLARTPTGVTNLPGPGVVTADSTYLLRGGQLERLDASGAVLASVPHGPGLVGLVGQDVLTVSPDGVIRRFSRELQELPLTP